MKIDVKNIQQVREAERGKIIILNGAPRSGKSSLAKVIQQQFKGVWMNIGVDHYMKMTPDHLLPGIGLRPGKEAAELEDTIENMYYALYTSIAVHSLLGLNVVVDVGHHEDYATKKQIFEKCIDILDGLPVYLIGVECGIDEIVRRRTMTGYNSLNKDGSIMKPVSLWQECIHKDKVYNLKVDTSTSSIEECVEQIKKYIFRK
ncbi:MAG: chloramphenicol phosphotransferase CPT family protein [Cellulosilyticaceae bacterium]